MYRYILCVGALKILVMLKHSIWIIFINELFVSFSYVIRYGVSLYQKNSREGSAAYFWKFSTCLLFIPSNMMCGFLLVALCHILTHMFLFGTGKLILTFLFSRFIFYSLILKWSLFFEDLLQCWYHSRYGQSFRKLVTRLFLLQRASMNFQGFHSNKR